MSVGDSIRRLRFHSKLLRRPLVLYRHRGISDEDAFLISYPRSGTTWLRFLLSEALTGEEPGFERDSNALHYVGDHLTAPRILPTGGRLIFSHEKVSIPPHKVIYVVRDPRSVVISEFRWLLRRNLHSGDLDNFVDRFVRGRTNPWGSWEAHVNYWVSSASARGGKVHLVTYEKLRTETLDMLKKALAFLGSARDRSVLLAAVEHNSLEKMRQKEVSAPDSAFERGTIRATGKFINTGKTAGWREALDPNQVARIEEAFFPTMHRLGYIPETATRLP